MKLFFAKKLRKTFSEFKENRLQILFVAVLIIGFSFRVLGVYPGYSPYHPDEGKAGYSSAWYMFTNRTLDLPHYHYPALIPTFELVFLVLLYLPVLWIKLFLDHPDLILSNLNKLPYIFETYIATRSDVEIMYLSRYLTAVVGFLIMVLTYLVSKKLFHSRLAALLSVIVLAVNLRAISSSQLDLPDAYSSFFLLIAFYTLLRLKDHPNIKLYLLSGFTVGLAISSKLQFFSLLPLALIHLYLTAKGDRWKGKIATLLSKNIIFCLLVLMMTLILVNIGPLTHWEKFTETVTRVSQLYGFGFNKLSLTGLSFFYQIVLTPSVALVALLGILMGLLRYRFATFLVLSMILIYLYYFLYLTRGWIYPRNFVGIVPFFAILAGFGLGNIWNVVARYMNRYVATFVFILILSYVLFESTKNSLVHTINYLKPWNMTLMRECLSKNVLEGKTIAAHPTDKYFLFSVPSIDVDKKLKFIPLSLESGYTLSELQEKGADYALVGLDVVGDQNSVWWMVKPNFWDKPKMVAENVFVSLAARELFQNTVCSAVKPWQAVENNYVFVRIPSPAKSEWSKIDSFEFDSKDALYGWHKVDGLLGRGDNLIWDGEEGKSKEGSLKIRTVSPVFPVVRWISPLFEIKPGSFYKAVASIKSSTDVGVKQRDGFLRIDFYENEPTAWNEETLGLSHNLSSRYFGEREWKSEEVIGLAPKEAKFATIGFQASAPSTSDFWFDDLVIYEGKNDDFLPETGFSSFRFTPDLDVFIPNLGSGY